MIIPKIEYDIKFRNQYFLFLNAMLFSSLILKGFSFILTKQNVYMIQYEFLS
jgi:hypothetical protein